MQAPSAKRALVFNLIVLGLCAGLITAGYLAGRHRVLSELDEHLWIVREGLVYGELIDEATHETAAKAYFDSETAADSLDEYAWTAPQVLTPFVGNGGQPGRYKNVVVNLYQCRSTRKLLVPKPEGVIRIFATGASVLYSSGASSNEQTICAHLETMLNSRLAPQNDLRYEVFAMANPGWSTTHERIAIENRISELEPDLVLSLSCAADIIWGTRRKNVLWVRSEPDQVFFNLINKVFELTGRELMPEVAWGEGKVVEPAVVAERLLWNVRLAQHALQLRNVPYYFFMQPALQLTGKAVSEREQYFVDRGAKEAPYYVTCSDLLRKQLGTLEADNFHFADLSTAFDDLPADDEIFLDTYHLGDRGNAMIAEAMFEIMEPVLRELR